MIVLELLYCLCCMVIFLLVVYWNAKGTTEVIFGRNSDFDSEEDMRHQEDSQTIQELNYNLQRKAFAQKYNINSDRPHLNNSLRNVSLTDPRYPVAPKATDLLKVDYRRLNKHSHSMRYDAVHAKPSLSHKVAKMTGGKVKEDKRLRML